jgi:hypothetical protein
MRSPRPLLPWLLIAALVAAPLASLPAAAQGGDGAHHALHGATDPGGHDDAPLASSSCDRHDTCQGQCCAACAQCFTAVFTLSLSLFPTYTVLSPTVPRLHDRLAVAPHDRPPAV